MPRTLLSFLVIALLTDVATAQKFCFDKPEPGFTQVTPDVTYSKDRGYGVDFDTNPQHDNPWYFSVALPEGNYNVTLVLGGDPSQASNTTVKAESRRLMLENIKTAPGQTQTRTITVNIHTPKIAGDGEIRLKPREHGVLHLDDKLTLEFIGQNPHVQSIDIHPAPPDTITVYLAGDSTVTDQPREPYNSWGQMITRFFKPGVAIANHAESGEALRAFEHEKRLAKILSTIKPGDYLLIQFGHNDEKEKGEGVGPFTTFKQSLIHYTQEAKKKGAKVVLITPVQRRTFDSNGTITNSHGDYPAAVRQVAREQDVPLIDLNATSKILYEAWGPKDAPRAFPPIRTEKTHQNDYGSYEIAKCVLEGIKQDKLDLARYIVDDFKGFDPSKPDPIDEFDVPADPMPQATTRPEGN